LKIIFLSFSTLADYHFYTDLELIKNNLDHENNDLYVFHCGGIIDSCFFHPIKTLANCYHCKSKFNNHLEYFKNDNLSYYGFLDKNIKLPDNIKYDFLDVKDLMSYKINDIDFGMAVASSIISILKDHNFDTKKHRELIKRILTSSLIIYFSFEKEVNIIKPDLVYLFNGRFAEIRPLIRLCEKNNIKYITHERGANIYKYDIFENALPHDYEYIFKEIELYWNKEDSNKISISEEWIENRMKGVDTSWYSFVKEQKKNLLPEKFDFKKRNITIFNSSEDEFAAIDEKVKKKFYNGQFDAIKSIVNNFKKHDDIHFYLRVHPNLKNLNNYQTIEIKLLSELKINNFTIIHAESNISTYDLIKNSDKIITFGSTVGIEAVYLNKPSIMIGNALYENLDCVYIPKSEQELFYLIEDKDLKVKNRDLALKYGYWESIHGYDFKYFKPENFATGKFMGKKINLYTHQVLFRKLLSLLHKFNFLKLKIKYK
jgi:hypothetical protein